MEGPYCLNRRKGLVTLRYICWRYIYRRCYIQGGHKPGKQGKPEKLRKFEKLSKSQGKLREIELLLKKPRKLRGNEKYVT